MIVLVPLPLLYRHQVHDSSFHDEEIIVDALDVVEIASLPDWDSGGRVSDASVGGIVESESAVAH